jgi:hypothetical protein
MGSSNSYNRMTTVGVSGKIGSNKNEVLEDNDAVNNAGRLENCYGQPAPHKHPLPILIYYNPKIIVCGHILSEDGKYVEFQCFSTPWKASS